MAVWSRWKGFSPSNTWLPGWLSGRSLEEVMRSLRQFGVLVLLLVSCLAPAMACMVPDVQMSTEERACCRAMKNQCGQMEMPASHGCCQKAPASVHDNALDTKAVVFHPVVVPVIWLAAFELVKPTSAVTGWVERPDYSPPQSPPSTISVLRI
jgi:hypothetical protein